MRALPAHQTQPLPCALALCATPTWNISCCIHACLQAWQKAQLLFKGQRPVPSPYCTRADFVHDFPFPQDDPLEDSLVAHAESEGLASTPTVAAPQQ